MLRGWPFTVTDDVFVGDEGVAAGVREGEEAFWTREALVGDREASRRA